LVFLAGSAVSWKIHAWEKWRRCTVQICKMNRHHFPVSPMGRIEERQRPTGPCKALNRPTAYAGADAVHEAWPSSRVLQSAQSFRPIFDSQTWDPGKIAAISRHAGRLMFQNQSSATEVVLPDLEFLTQQPFIANDGRLREWDDLHPSVKSDGVRQPLLDRSQPLPVLGALQLRVPPR